MRAPRFEIDQRSPSLEPILDVGTTRELSERHSIISEGTFAPYAVVEALEYHDHENGLREIRDDFNGFRSDDALCVVPRQL